MNIRATIVSLPLIVGLAYASGTMRGTGWTPPPEPSPRCYTEVVLPDRSGSRARLWMDCELSAAIVPPPGNTIGKQLWQRSRVHPVKLFYDRAPEQDPPRVASAAPGKNAAGCKPGRTRNRYGICGRWR
jgi:hypothetical protein